MKTKKTKKPFTLKATVDDNLKKAVDAACERAGTSEAEFVTAAAEEKLARLESMRVWLSAYTVTAKNLPEAVVVNASSPELAIEKLEHFLGRELYRPEAVEIEQVKK
jgi:hypothetical protein